MPKSADSKDVKSPVLPKSVSASAAAPVARRVREKKRVLIEDWVSADGASSEDDVPATSSAVPTAANALPSPSPSAKCSDGKDDQSSMADKWDSKLSALQSELDARYAALEHDYFAAHGERSNPADCKHFFTTNLLPSPAFGAISGTEFASALCNPGGGNQINQRLTQTIKVHRIKLRVVFNLIPVGLASGTIVWPRITMLVLRDKLPSIPGTFPPMWATDFNPPSGDFNLFSRLSLAQNFSNDRMAVINPVAAERYHVYELKHFDTKKWYDGADRFAGNSATLGAGWVQGMQHSEEFDINCHGAKSVFDSATAGSQAVQNAMIVVFRSDYNSTAQETSNGFTFSYTWSQDATFEDVADDM